jgi:hypothetical protein
MLIQGLKYLTGILDRVGVDSIDEDPGDKLEGRLKCVLSQLRMEWR